MNFFQRIDEFNRMYGMPVSDKSTNPTIVRLDQFSVMLYDELDERTDTMASGLEGQVELADWLGDIIVYCTSEARRHGIPIEQVLQIIMDSNASKMGADGKPIFKDGKLQKGPNYWKPEPKIRELLEGLQ